MDDKIKGVSWEFIENIYPWIEVDIYVVAQFSQVTKKQQRKYDTRRDGDCWRQYVY